MINNTARTIFKAINKGYIYMCILIAKMPFAMKLKRMAGGRRCWCACACCGKKGKDNISFGMVKKQFMLVSCQSTGSQNTSWMAGEIHDT